MKLFARHELVRSAIQSDEPALLLEGVWPAGEQGPLRWSLDEWIDVRHAWIDDEASRLAERAGHGLSGEIALAYLNALPLRYYLVKLLRVVAAFKSHELQAAETLELHLTRGRDEDYAEVIGELVEELACKVQIHWHDGCQARKNNSPHNALWRRWAAKVHQWSLSKHLDRDRRNFVLCGNPRILNPVCAELVRRGARVWWLYDRFAVGTWRQWRHAGVGQLVCNSSLGRTQFFSEGCSSARLVSRNVNLTRSVDRWLKRLAGEVGASQSSLLEQIDLYFGQVQPDALVVDEDATPLTRAAVAVARRMGIESTVVQHGVPCVQFGFAPLAADRICAWDAGSQRQLECWGIPSERIVVTGSSQEKVFQQDNISQGLNSSNVAELVRVWDAACQKRTKVSRLRLRKEARKSANAGPRLLLLATVPPTDDRPEPATFHLTGQTYANMLRLACAAAARIPGAQLMVKLHPRAPDSADVQQAAAEFPGLSLKIVSNESLPELLADCDCVLSCVSSAGIEAASLGLPVIQLLPIGSGHVLPAEDYGLIGSARTLEEFNTLLEQALSHSLISINQTSTSSAVQRIVDVILNTQSQKSDQQTQENTTGTLINANLH